MTDSRPNLFTYATSELSQDAWICWLVAHVDCDERPELRDAARGFVALLWNLAHPGDVIKGSDVRDLRDRHPLTQHEHIDVLFEVGVRGRRVVFLVEDKTDTSHHSGQLARYRSIVEPSGSGTETVPVYFKTGYHFEHDAGARAHGYVVVSLRDLVAFLQRHTDVQSDIFRDYARHQEGAYAERTSALAALAGPHGARELHRAFAQHAFLVLLRERAKTDGDRVALHHGTGLGGTPWANWEFEVTANTLASAVKETLFHRVDARQDAGERRYYVSTRQYARVKNSPEARREKLVRLGRYRALFRDAVTDAGTPLRFGKPSGDHRGANESEIGVLFFDDTQTTRDVLEHFPAVHRAFVARVRAGTGALP
jgi:hypothetical protein